MTDSEAFNEGEIIGEGAIRFKRRLPGPIERVWAYLVDSDKRALWLAAGALTPTAGSEFQLSFANSDLAPGAETPERFRKFGGRVVSTHTVLRAEPPHTLAFSWSGGAGEEPSEVTIELTQEGDQVLLTLTHRRLDQGVMVMVGAGWRTHLAILEARDAGHTPRPFWTLHAEYEAAMARRLGGGEKES